MFESKLTRREMLRAALLGSAALAVAACAPQTETETPPIPAEQPKRPHLPLVKKLRSSSGGTSMASRARRQRASASPRSTQRLRRG